MKKLQRVRHKNILTPLEVVEEGKEMYAMYEYSSGESLENYVVRKGSLLESEVKDIVRQVVAIYKELIKEDIVHKNIKPRNILLEGESVCLCDFEVAKKVLDKELYIAPEIRSNPTTFTSKSIWSIGAVTYFMINGKSPKHETKDNKIDKKVNGYSAKAITPYCLDFISKCLQYEVSKRLTFKEMIIHPFISEQKNEDTIVLLSKVENKIKFTLGKSTKAL
jgi:serine/threonine protein kinase